MAEEAKALCKKSWLRLTEEHGGRTYSVSRCVRKAGDGQAESAVKCRCPNGRAHRSRAMEPALDVTADGQRDVAGEGAAAPQLLTLLSEGEGPGVVPDARGPARWRRRRRAARRRR